MKHSVLFVCSANICRSPMAMALWRKRLGATAGQWRIESAGTWPLEGERAASKARQVMQEMGADLESHRARPVVEEDMHDFRLILTMEAGQKEALQVEFPEYTNRVFRLSEMIFSEFDLGDPIGGSVDEFRLTAQQIDRILGEGKQQIFERSQEDNKVNGEHDQ